MSIRLIAPVLALLALATPGFAQSPTGCPDTAQSTAPATPPNPGDGSGSNPGSSGSTGWTGGLGGSNIGTSQSGPTTGSTSDHSKTAEGVNPVPTPADPVSGPKAGC